MKTLLYIALGIISALLTVRFGLGAIRNLLSLELTTCIINCFVTSGLGILTVKIFEEI